MRPPGRLLASSISALALFASPRAHAQDEPALAPVERAPVFGAPGQWVLGGATSLGIQHEGHAKLSDSFFEVAGQLSLDRFVLPNLSLGLDLGAGHTSARAFDESASGPLDSGATWVALGPRVGLNVPLGERVSLFPRLTLGVEWRRQTVPYVFSDPSAGALVPDGFPTSFARSSFSPWGAAYAPVLFHVAPHFFVGVGPRVVARFSDDTTVPRVQAGFGLEVGGHWGGEPHAAPSETDPDATAPRYGDRGSLVLTNALGLSGDVSTYKIAGTRTALTVAPSADWFVARNVTFGGALSFEYASQNGTHGERVEAAPRVGVVLPFAPRVRLHPHLSLGLGHHDPGSGGSSPHVYAWVGLDAPVLVDVAPHFFVGFGPSLVQEIVRHYESGFDGDRLTRVAADGVLGGWF